MGVLSRTPGTKSATFLQTVHLDGSCLGWQNHCWPLISSGQLEDQCSNNLQYDRATKTRARSHPLLTQRDWAGISGKAKWFTCTEWVLLPTHTLNCPLTPSSFQNVDLTGLAVHLMTSNSDHSHWHCRQVCCKQVASGCGQPGEQLGKQRCETPQIWESFEN